MRFDDTICAPATIAGTGAISVIRVSGPDALGIADRVISFKHGRCSEAQGYSVKFGSVSDNGELVDEVLVTIFRTPHSYTGEDSVEISCHASAYIVDRIISRLTAEGARFALPGEFTQRAFINGRMDLAQAEAVADLIAAESRAAHKVAISQMRGGYSAGLRTLRDKMLELSALLELELDFSEEEVEFADRSRLCTLLDDASRFVDRLKGSFRDGNAIRNGIPVAIAGPVNSGKSTLLNALLGEDRAIVSDIAGTTRDTVEEVFNLDGLKYRFIDTAGLRKTEDIVENIGIGRSWEKIEKADIVLCVLDATDPEGAAVSLDEISGRISDSQTLIAVSNKTDISPALNGTLAISARNRVGLDELRHSISDSQKDRFNTGSDILVTNQRHYQALTHASDDLSRARRALGSNLPADLVAEDLRSAIASINTILGDQITADNVLGEIFEKFCIGK